jgi:hypothetical protein
MRRAHLFRYKHRDAWQVKSVAACVPLRCQGATALELRLQSTTIHFFLKHKTVD